MECRETPQVQKIVPVVGRSCYDPMPRRPDLPLESPQNKDCRRIHLWDAFAAPLQSWRHSRTTVSGSPLPENGRNPDPRTSQRSSGFPDLIVVFRTGCINITLYHEMDESLRLVLGSCTVKSGEREEYGMRECPATSTSGSDLDQGPDVPRRLFDKRNMVPASDVTERSRMAF